MWRKQIDQQLIEAFIDRLFDDKFKLDVYAMRQALENYAYSAYSSDYIFEDCDNCTNLFDLQEELEDLEYEIDKTKRRNKFLEDNSVVFTMEEE